MVDIWPLQDQSSFQKQSRAAQSRLEPGELAVGREAGHEAVAGEIQQGPQPPRATDSGGCATGNPEGIGYQLDAGTELKSKTIALFGPE